MKKILLARLGYAFVALLLAIFFAGSFFGQHANAISEPFGPEMESVSSSGAQAATIEQSTALPEVSDDGNIVGFVSQADNLDPSGNGGVFIHNRTTGLTTLESIYPDGTVAPVNASFTLSGNGEFIAFDTAVEGGNGQSAVYVRNLDTNTTVLASVDSEGNAINNSTSGYISDDGSLLTFSQNNENTGKSLALYQRDMITGQTTLISGYTDFYTVSRNGQYIVTLNNYGQPFIYNTQTDTSVPAAVDSSGNPLSDVLVQALSDDGNYVAFSYQDTSFGGTDGATRCYRQNVQTGVTQLIDVNSDGSDPANPGCGNVYSLSADGSIALFDSNENIGSINPSNSDELYVHNFTTGVTNIVSRTDVGAPVNGSVSEWAYNTLTPDGSYFAFAADASNINNYDCSGIAPDFSSDANPDDQNSQYCLQEIYLSSTAQFTITDTTPPTLGTPVWTNNPLAGNTAATLTVPATDNPGGTGVVGGEYFVGNPVTDDPGQGNGTPMTWDGTNLTADFDNSWGTGTYTINVRAEDAVGNWSPVASTTLTIEDIAPTITSPAIATIDARQPANVTITTSGSPNASITESGNLPTGISFTDNGDGTATISGQASPVNNGLYAIDITATNDAGTATQTLYLSVDDVNSVPTFISPNSDTAAFGQPYSFTVDTTGDPIPTITKNITVPSGLSWTDNKDGTATISGTPSGNADGVYIFTFKAKNNQGTATQTFVLTVTKAPVISSIGTQSLQVGTAYSKTVTVKGSPTPSISVSGLPAGLSFTDNGNGTGSINGTPAVGSGGQYTITITGTNSQGVSTKTFTMNVHEAPNILSSGTATATVGSPFAFQVTSLGYPTPSLNETGKLPSGVTFTNDTGAFSGNPAAGTEGTYNITISARNTDGTSVQSFSLVIE